MYIVRQKPVSSGNGASYLIEASRDYPQKYRLSKTAKSTATVFKNRKTAMTWAKRLDADVVSL